ncbi:unnamed protein product, partial [Effrenium voratum]
MKKLALFEALLSEIEHEDKSIVKQMDISGQISEILDQGFHKAGVLAALRGRLQFAETQIAGRQACR